MEAKSVHKHLLKATVVGNWKSILFLHIAEFIHCVFSSVPPVLLVWPVHYGILSSCKVSTKRYSCSK